MNEPEVTENEILTAREKNPNHLNYVINVIFRVI